MLDKLLKAKHWQLFIIVVGVPVVIQCFFMAYVFSQISHNNPPDPFMVFSAMPFIFIFYLVSAVILFGWYYAIVIKMDTLIPTPLKINMRRFKIFFFIPIIYFVIIISIVIFVFTQIEPGHGKPPVGPMIAMVFLVIPFHLFSLFCIGHTFYCVGKSIKLAELQRQVKFEDYAGEFFLAWFYLVGFWILQPRLNKLASEKLNPEFRQENIDDILS